MKTIITSEHINIILLGIERGLTIQKCCRDLLHIDSNTFYYYATQEQKDQVRIHKLLHNNIHNCYGRTRYYKH